MFNRYHNVHWILLLDVELAVEPIVSAQAFPCSMYVAGISGHPVCVVRIIYHSVSDHLVKNKYQKIKTS